jgi:intracellular sulfur oxidation DsrE/DsrF family protein
LPGTGKVVCTALAAMVKYALFLPETSPMNRRSFIQAGAFASLAAAAPFLIAAHAQQAGATGQKRHKVVIQMSDGDPAKWNLALNNARNLQEDVGAANVDIEIVAYGPGIGMLKLESPTGARIADAMKANIKVIACENTMRGQKLGKEDMLPAISYVPAGVTEIVKRQAEGWSYLRP